MTLPGVSYVVVNGTFLNGDGSPKAGEVAFQSVNPANQTALNLVSGDTFIGSDPIVVTLDSSGSISVTLIATDSPNVTPTGFYWSVSELFGPTSLPPFLIQLPARTTPVELVPGSSPPYTPLTLGFVSTFNQRYGSVTLTASDVTTTGASLPPNGTAGGDLTGTYPNPTLTGSANVESIITANTTVAGAVPKSTVTTKGDLIAATGNAAVSRLGVGTDTYVLTADSTQTTGIKWAAAAGGGGFNGFDYGDGSDGVINFDGTNTYAGIETHTGSAGSLIYTLVRDVLATNLTIATGITVNSANNIMRATGTMTINGTQQSNGGNASGATGGTAPNSGSPALSTGPAGANGGTTTGGGSGTSGLGIGGKGGQGGNGPSGNGGNPSVTLQARLSGWQHTLSFVDYFGVVNAPIASSPMGGSGGGGDGTHSGGGGGASGGSILDVAKTLVIGASAVIQCNGGNGANGTGGNAGGGGAGGGGAIQLTSPNFTNNGGTIQCLAGSIGHAVGTGSTDGSAGAAGFTQTTTSWPT